jgi:heat shock protein HtpX
MHKPSVRYFQLQNLIHSILLLAGMFALLSFIGWLLMGGVGILWSLAIVVFVVVSSKHLSPRFILYLYRARPVSPQQAPDLYDILHQLANRASLQYVPQLYIIPSRIMNAFTVGQHQHTYVAISDALLSNMNLREMAGILAHEVAHIHHNDLWVMTLADVLSRITNLLAITGTFLILVYLPLFILLGETIPWLLLIVLLLSPNLSALLQLALSRSREYNADIEAVNLAGDPHGLASALEKIEYYQGGWVERILFPGRRASEPSLLRTHPQTVERIKRIYALAGR